MRRMGVFRMMVMMVVVTVMMMGVVVVILRLEPTHAGTKICAEGTIFDIRPRSIRALPFDMVMMRFLNGADLTLKAKNLRTVFAHRTIGRWDLTDLLGYPLGKSLEHHRMIIELSLIHI